MSNTKEIEVPLLYPKCPGCKTTYLTADGTGVPVKKLMVVSSVLISNGLSLSILFPFMYFMVDDFQIAKSPEDIGYYAGAISAIYMFGRVLTSVHWGIFADKYGRIPAIQLGLVSIVVCQLIFGVSSNFWLSFFTRLLFGCCNGILGPIKAYATEICSVENQAWGLTVVSMSWSLGLIIGPAIGGFLARPAINYPDYFSQDSLFGRFPYLLPCLCQAIFAAFNILLVLRLPETIHKHNEEQESTLDVEKNSDNAKPSLWRNWPLMATIAVYCSWSGSDTGFREVFSLWCVSPEETDGLGMKTSDVGTVLAIGGFSMLCFQTALFPVMAKRFGPIMVSKITAMLVIPIVMSFPFVSALEGRLQWLVLTSLTALRDILVTMVITGSFLLTNNAVSAKDRGQANGIAVSAVSLCRGIGPGLAGAVFAWGQSRHNPTILPGSQMVFFALDATCVVALLTLFPPFLPKKLDHPFESSEPLLE